MNHVRRQDRLPNDRQQVKKHAHGLTNPKAKTQINNRTLLSSSMSITYGSGIITDTRCGV